MHKTVIRQFGFTEKVYRSVTVSVQRQWLSLAKERTKTFIAPVEGASYNVTQTEHTG